MGNSTFSWVNSNGVIYCSNVSKNAKIFCDVCKNIRVTGYTQGRVVLTGKRTNHCRACADKISGLNKKGKSTRSEEKNEEHRKRMMGKNNPNWRGGSTSLKDSVRTLAKYKLWRLNIFKRDAFSCTICGASESGNLEADHIKPFNKILKDNFITTTEQANKCSELWEEENGRTLCKECHKKTDTYGPKRK